MAAVLYLPLFLGYYVVPKDRREQIYATPVIDRHVLRAIDAESGGRADDALLINLALLAGFVVPHSLMAREGFKRLWTRVVPRPIERSTYVLVSGLTLALLFWFWKPIPETVWPMEGTILANTDAQFRVVFQTAFYFGWALVILSTFAIDHFDLFGLRQVYLYLRGREYTPTAFKTPLLYRWVRHPMMLGLLIAIWATPVMTLGHMVFSGVMTLYIVVGILLEERSLAAAHGDAYLDYKRRTSMLLPLRWRRS
jgi:protein-S-isoprenylcysteine O-methyltransferase Ste14